MSCSPYVGSSTYSPRLHRHGSNELHHTFHSDIPFFGEDIGPISYVNWMWDTKNLVQPFFNRYNQSDILRHVISKFVERAYEWWHKSQSRVEKGRESSINTFYELKTCMWKTFVPSSFRITREQQSKIENFIDIGDAFIQNQRNFSHQEKNNLKTTLTGS